MAKRYKYNPSGTLLSPGLKPGTEVEARDEDHAAQLEASPCFTPIKAEATSEPEESSRKSKTPSGGK